MNRQFMEELARKLHLEPEKAQMLAVAAAHDYYCTCETCKQYWKSVGPDPETGNFGPFSAEEIAGAA